MPKSSELHIAPGHVSGRIRSPALGGVGSPSTWPSTDWSRRTSYGLKGALDPDCDDDLFDCPGKQEEEEMEAESNEKNESLIREFVRSILILDGVTLQLNPTSHIPMATTSSTPSPSGRCGSACLSGSDSNEDDLIDEDELEEEDEVEEVNAIGMGGGGGVSRGTIRGVTLPLGQSPPSHGRKRRTPAEAAGSGFGGAKPYMPGKRKKGKKSRKTNK